MAFDYRKEYHRYKQYYLRLQTLSKQPIAQASFTLLISLLSISFFGIFAIRPTLNTIARLTKEIQEKTKVNKQLENKIKILKKAEANYSQIETYISLVNTALPKEPGFELLEQQIEYLAWHHQTNLVSGTFNGFIVVGDKSEQEKTKKNKEDTNKNSTAENIKFSLILGGNYQNLKNFVTDLEKLDRVILIDSIHFTKETDIENAEVQISLNGQAFYKKI